MNGRPEIAIVTPNYLMGLGFKSIIDKLIPMADIEIFEEVSNLIEADHNRFMHYFVTKSVFSNNINFFEKNCERTILMVEGEKDISESQFRSINICQSEEALVRDVLKLRNHSHVASHSIRQYAPHNEVKEELTKREKEVIGLIALGHINKEIADKLSISIATVISHRKNIVTKLKIKSVAGLTIYALNNGFVNPDAIFL